MATSRPRARESYQVHLDAQELGGLVRVGTLWRHDARADVPAAFEYDPAWLQSGMAFMLDPRLELYRGEQHPAHPASAFGVFMDSAPDRWGRVLMERREAIAALREDRKPRRLREMDFLLGVHDLTRMGALRLRATDDGPFLDHSALGAPPVTDLEELARASRAIENADAEKLPEYERWLAMLIAPGSSLGGARPKANFMEEDGSLWLAKFPARDDRYDVGAWELVARNLAQRAGIWMPEARGLRLTDRHLTYCAKRFDREGQSRRMFSSAMTLLEYTDGEDGASYLDLAEFLSDQGAQSHIEADLDQLFRRVLFNIRIGNRDDHLRNHGFIRTPTGWHLAPAYDVNPNPHKDAHGITVDGQTDEPDIHAAMACADLYRVSGRRAQELLREVDAAVAGWRDEAATLGLGRSEVAVMERVIGA
ncbi:type II toxin-antitoxin system HipA family toxin [Diaphorobacter limosus]|jgi:serine/threonine-protein kinase HipA|uniref:Type II toxin-antitoxin system HipA family toxin n=1 Tax=Diaphorobacter limosus TaxID=3036128 RepID=A0ABZ0J1J1_9BURK|nr:type II toxin-antitoxin system HipA family toxin [Diaphorobacter sp. Y-1]WOO32056.1 type II toxin-antitoxin system HipA family toxin [Diaphorobacter sp. Y-1]